LQSKNHKEHLTVTQFPDKYLLFSIFLLVAGSVIVVFSASSTRALGLTGNSAFYFHRHLFRVVLGIFGLIFLMSIPYNKLRFWGLPLLIVSLGFLAVLAVPGIVEPVKGSRRFIPLLGQSMQPSEFAKLFLIMFLADSIARRGEDFRSLPGYFRRLAVIGLVGVLTVVQPNFSMGMLICLIGVYVMYIGNAKPGHLLITGVLAVPFVAFVALTRPYQIERIRSWWQGIWHPELITHQVKQSLIALGDGGLLGVGVGHSQQKEYFLPEPFTDFVFSILGEEMGLWGTTLTVIIFLVIAYRGAVIARKAPDVFGFLLAGGISFAITIYAVCNLCVVTGLLPVTGLPLPILTYGGSSLIVTMCMAGILLSISRYGVRKDAAGSFRDGR